MSGWLAIDRYDSMPKKEKPARSAFLFREEISERDGSVKLPRTVQLQRHFGSRTCTHFHPLDELPE